MHKVIAILKDSNFSKELCILIFICNITILGHYLLKFCIFYQTYWGGWIHLMGSGLWPLQCLGQTLAIIIGIVQAGLDGHVSGTPLKIKLNEIMSTCLFTSETLCLKFDFLKNVVACINCAHCMIPVFSFPSCLFYPFWSFNIAV